MSAFIQTQMTLDEARETDRLISAISIRHAICCSICGIGRLEGVGV